MGIQTEFTILHTEFIFGSYHETVNSFFKKIPFQNRRGGKVGDCRLFYVCSTLHKQNKRRAISERFAGSDKNVDFFLSFFIKVQKEFIFD